MTEPTTPQDIARRTFDVARRGYEQQEVRGFLHEVSALLDRLQREEVELRERAERAETRLGMADKPDDATLMEVLGEETTRVLTSAREAAAEIRSKAEEAASRMIEEATSAAAEARADAVREADARRAEAKQESEALLEAARTELDRRRAEAQEEAARIQADAQANLAAMIEEGQAEVERARHDGDAEREAGRQEGRAMVAEAQLVRERVLKDLAVRRKRARQQVEKLNAGRERLLQAYDVVRRTMDEATNELSVSLTDARIQADAAARRIDEEPEPTLAQLDEEVANAGLIDLPIAGHVDVQAADSAPVDARDTEDESPGPFSGEVPTLETSGGDATPAVTAPSASARGNAPRTARFGDERRGRKRRRKGFEGLPAGELTVVEPPGEDESVRVLTTDAPTEPDGAEELPQEADSVPAEGEAQPADDQEVSAEHAAEPASPADEQEVSPADAPDEQPSPGDAADEQPSPDDAADPASPADEQQASPDDAADPASPEKPGSEAESGPPVGSSADALFARLRAGRQADDDGAPASPPAPDAEAADRVEREDPSDEVDTGAPVDGAAEPSAAAETETEAAASDEGDARSFAARRSAAASVEKDLARRLKRALADEQNEVLDLLRRAKPRGVDDLLPGIDEHAARWAQTVEPPLRDAAGAGADWSGGEPSSVTDLADELARDLIAPLRERIERSFTASDGNLDDVADRVRALYREWRGPRLTETTVHFVGAAYARGVLDGTEPGAPVRWVLDPAAGPCPDCDDNVLAGVIAKGEAFPTGNVSAPAHPGCHCLVLPAEG